MNVAELEVAPSQVLTPTKRLEQQAMTLPEQANAVLITNQESYDAAVDLLKATKSLRVQAEQHHRPMIDAAHKSWKASLAGLQKIDEPLAQAEKTLKGKIGDWATEQERIRREEELRLQAEAKRLQDEALEKELEALESAGVKPEEISTVIAQAEFQPIVSPRPVTTYAPAKGVSTQERFSAECFNLIEFVRFVAMNPQFIGLLQVNQTALNTMARAMKQTMNFPGVKVKREAGVSVRS